jgi:hypothetical protein
MAAPQKPETFMLSSEAQQALPQDAQVALQQVDNRKLGLADAMTAVHLQLHKPALTLHSQVLPHISTSRLDARSIYQEVLVTNWRICFLRSMVSRALNDC